MRTLAGRCLNGKLMGCHWRTDGFASPLEVNGSTPIFRGAVDILQAQIGGARGGPDIGLPSQACPPFFFLAAVRGFVPSWILLDYCVTAFGH